MRDFRDDGQCFLHLAIGDAMEEPYELAVAMLGLALAAIMLVAGALYLVMGPESPPTSSPPASVLMSSR